MAVCECNVCVIEVARGAALVNSLDSWVQSFAHDLTLVIKSEFLGFVLFSQDFTLLEIRHLQSVAKGIFTRDSWVVGSYISVKSCQAFAADSLRSLQLKFLNDSLRLHAAFNNKANRDRECKAQHDVATLQFQYQLVWLNLIHWNKFTHSQLVYVYIR